MLTYFSIWARTPVGHSVLALLLGMLAVMGFAPHHIAGVVLLSMMGLLGILSQAPHWRYAAWLGLMYGFGLFGLGMNWLGISLTVYGGVPFGFGWLMVMALAVVLASFVALFAGLSVYLKSRLSIGIWAIFLVPTLWTLTEWLRVVIWDGFPWLLFAYSHTDTLLAAWAQLGGNLAVTFVVMMSAGILWWLWTAERWLVGGAAFAALWGISWQLGSIQWVVADEAERRSIALVHSQTPETVKWQSGAQEGLIDAHVRASLAVLRDHPNVKLIAWPETAIPTFIDAVQPQLLALQHQASAQGVTILTGTAIREDRIDGRQYFNSIATLTGDVHYDKRHLVPFSEYYPGFSLLHALAGFIGMPMAQFSAGTTPRVMALLGDQVGLGVCYEADFLHELAQVNTAINWWLIVSDDGWFYPSWMAEQHWQMTRLHAIALGRDIARVTNLGITGVAQADGKTQVAATPQDGLGAKIVTIQHYHGHTPYSRWQDLPMLGFLTFMLTLMVMQYRRRVINSTLDQR